MSIVSSTHVVWGECDFRFPGTILDCDDAQTEINEIDDEIPLSKYVIDSPGPRIEKLKKERLKMSPYIARAIDYYSRLEEGELIDGMAIGEGNDEIYVERLCTAQDGDNEGYKELLVYNQTVGSVKGVRINPDNQTNRVIKVDQSDNTTIFLALMPDALEDDEFLSTLAMYKDQIIDADYQNAYRSMVMLVSNIMQRITNVKVIEDKKIKLDLPDNYELALIMPRQIQKGTVAPRTAIVGTFELFQSKLNTTSVKLTKIDREELKLNLSRALTTEEKDMIWKIPSHHHITDQEIEIANDISRSWNDPAHLRVNSILLEGAAGSGKTETTKAVSGLLHIPYTKITCFSDMDSSNVIGSHLPVDGGESLNIGDLPTEDEIHLDPIGSYEQLAGIKDNNISEDEVISCLFKKLKESSKTEIEKTGGISFKYFPSEILRAFEHGYLLEIQEPTCIADASVLTILNSALEYGGTINLHDRIVKKSPDFICLTTTNRNYEGCRPLNQALRSRFDFVYKCETPDVDEMVKRVSTLTEYKEIETLKIACETTKDLDKKSEAEGYGGIAGMRGVINFAIALKHGDEPLKAFYKAVVHKITTDDDALVEIQEYLDTSTRINEMSAYSDNVTDLRVS